MLLLSALLWACVLPMKRINILDERCLMLSDDVTTDNGLVVPDRGSYNAITLQAWVFRLTKSHGHGLEGGDGMLLRIVC
jgi:hypothetical protein